MKTPNSKFPNTKFKLLGLMTTTALLGTLLATASIAQPRGRGGFDQQAPRSEIRGTRAERGNHRTRAQPQRFIERHDADADGRVSEVEFIDERLQYVDAQFEQRDTDGDGAISHEEHEAPRNLPSRRNARTERARPGAAVIDRNAVTACVRETIANYEPHRDAVPEDNFASIDTDGDNKLRLTEASAAIEARAHERFARLDGNGDGYVTDDEVEAQFAVQPEARGAVRDCVREQRKG